MALHSECCICGGTEFVEHNTRANACCRTCRSLERTRLMWLVLARRVDFALRPRVLHFAPEVSLASKLYGLIGDNYVPCDVDVGLYNAAGLPVEVIKVDMCYLHRLPAESFDIILHNHVLEHACCPVDQCLYNLKRLLKPGGQQFFSVPFRGDKTREDLDPNLSPQLRREQFGQEDHMRLFGREDFIALLDRVYRLENIEYNMHEVFSRETFEQYNIPLSTLKDLTGETIFSYRKDA